MVMKASQVPLEIDVWNVIEEELQTGLQDVLDLQFEYLADRGRGSVVISHLKNSRIYTERIVLAKEGAESTIIRLSKEFNFDWTNLAELSFVLKPGEVPVFSSRFYPCVSDESALDKSKSRMNPITID